MCKNLLMKTRYCLYYADDIVEKGRSIKQEIHNQINDADFTEKDKKIF